MGLRITVHVNCQVFVLIAEKKDWQQDYEEEETENCLIACVAKR